MNHSEIRRRTRRRLMQLIILERIRLITSPRRSCWVNDLLLLRSKHGFYNWLIPELLKNERYKIEKFLRMTKPALDAIIRNLRPRLEKHSTFRECVSPEEKVIIALRFYATGESYDSLTWGFLRAPNTISLIVTEVSIAIFEVFQPLFLNTPSTTGEWKQISDQFESKWQFPNCLGKNLI